MLLILKSSKNVGHTFAKFKMLSDLLKKQFRTEQGNLPILKNWPLDAYLSTTSKSGSTGPQSGRVRRELWMSPMTICPLTCASEINL